MGVKKEFPQHKLHESYEASKITGRWGWAPDATTYLYPKIEVGSRRYYLYPKIAHTHTSDF